MQTCEGNTILTEEVGEVTLWFILSEVEYRENAPIGASVSDGHAVAFEAAADIQVDNEHERALFIGDDVVAFIT